MSFEAPCKVALAELPSSGTIQPPLTFFPQTVDYAPQLDAPAAALLSEEELAVCTTSHKPRQLAAFKMQHLLAEAEPHLPKAVVRWWVGGCNAMHSTRQLLAPSLPRHTVLRAVVLCMPDLFSSAAVWRGLPAVLRPAVPPPGCTVPTLP